VLDRDGTLNRLVARDTGEPPESPLDLGEVEILPGVPALLGRLSRAGFRLAVASNQPAAAKGKVARAVLDAIHARVLSEAQASGGRIDSSHICYHRAEDRCACRKPATLLLEQALGAAGGAPPAVRWMVGDRATDVLAGAAVGFLTALVGTPSAADEDLLAARAVQPSFRGVDLQEFVDFLLDDPPR
jgi:D-glycero-D-manno-heptose 1,7-bisphosphate phosphatase